MLNQHKLLSPAAVEPLLRGRFGRPYLWSEACASTQDVLRGAELPEGAVAVTEHQTDGRGRERRRWTDEPGMALLVSLLLRPPAGSPSQQLSLVCALAVAETVEGAVARTAGVKWPNDVLLDGRKVAGILLESAGGAVVCGVGLNVDQTESGLPRDARIPAASLRTATGRAYDRTALLVSLLGRLEARYDAWLRDGLAALLAELERRDVLRGTSVTVGEATGTADGLAPDGRLRLRGTDGTTSLIASGEVDGTL